MRRRHRDDINWMEFKRIVKIYDADKKELIIECESIGDAFRITGVRSIGSYIKSKSKSYKNKLNKTLAFR